MSASRPELVGTETPKRPLLEEATTAAITASFRDVHRAFGFGYREYIYSLAMERDLIAKDFRVDREVAVMVYYRGEPLAPQTVDMIVNERVIVENKAVERLRPDTQIPAVQLPLLDRSRSWVGASFWSRATLPSRRLREPLQASTPIEPGETD